LGGESSSLKPEEALQVPAEKLSKIRFWAMLASATCATISFVDAKARIEDDDVVYHHASSSHNHF